MRHLPAADRSLFLLFVASLPIVRPVSTTLFGLMVPIGDVLFAAAALAWIVRLFTGGTTLRWTRFYVPLALYLAAVAVSAVFSTDRSQSAAKLAGTAYLIAVAGLTVNMVASWTSLKQVLHAFLAGTAVTAFVGVAGLVLFWAAGLREPASNVALAAYGGLPAGDYPRLRALFANPNMLCNYLGVGVVMLSVMHALGWLGTLWHRVVSAGAWLTAAGSLSPGFGGLLLAAGWLRWQQHRDDPRRRRMAAAGLTLAAAAAAAILVATLISPIHYSTRTVRVPVIDRVVELAPRVRYWEASARSFLESPIVGRGAGLPTARWVGRRTGNEIWRDAHNVWINVGAEAGVLGLLAFGAVASYAWRCTGGAGTDEARTRIVKQGLRAALVSVLLFQGLSGAFEDARHLWVLFGLMVSAGWLDEWQDYLSDSRD
jgi:O-antigen ligase